jgi:hypothetical protein
MFNELYCFSVPENLFINKKVRKYSAPNYISMLNELKEEHYLTGKRLHSYLIYKAVVLFQHGQLVQYQSMFTGTYLLIYGRL